MGADPESRFEEIYGSSYGPLLGYALRRCPDPEDAADVVAETFMVAWRRIEEVPRGGEAKLWLFGVARKVLANQRRGERRHEQRTAALRAELAASPLVAEPPAEDSQVGRVFRTLSDDDRELLSLVAWDCSIPDRSPRRSASPATPPASGSVGPVNALPVAWPRPGSMPYMQS